MRLSTALAETMQLFGLTVTRVSQATGLGTGTIWEITHGKHTHTSLATVQTIARGLGTIDKRVRAYFVSLLFLDDEDSEAEFQMTVEGNLQANLNDEIDPDYPEENVKSISRVMRALDKLHIIARPTLGRWRRYFDAHPELPQVEEWVSRIMKSQRMNESIDIPDIRLIKTTYGRKD